MIKTGLDVLLDRPRALEGRRYALLAHGASVSVDLEPIHLALERVGAPRPALLMGPEHGFYGVEQDMVASQAMDDPWTGAPIASLYGDNADSLRPDPALFDQIDLLVIDLQDVGSRYYTYAATAVWAAQAALSRGREVWILDRPNPLDGVTIEGNARRDGFESFVGAFAIPVRHGLTLAELVRLELLASGSEDGLTCWLMEGWDRSMAWPETQRPWIAPSPNIPRFTTASIYPGGCLIEATEVSEGRGTANPFELIGAPGLDARGLAEALGRLDLPGCRFVPTFFKPQFQKHAGEVCSGVRWIVTDRERFSPYRAGVELLAALWTSAGRQVEWRRAPYEFVTDQPTIDLLSGDDRLRLALEAGNLPRDWIATWTADEEAFRARRREILLYPETAA